RLVDSLIVSAGRFHHVDLNRDDSIILCKYYVKCIHDLLKKTGVTTEMISQVITQNANPLLITQCLESIGLDPSRIFSDNQTRYAHLDCLDFLVNLKDLMNANPKDNN